MGSTTRIAGLLLGAVALNVIIAACGVQSANADVAAACQSWATIEFNSMFVRASGPTVNRAPGEEVYSSVMPDGWEPYATSLAGNPMLRRCVR